MQPCDSNSYDTTTKVGCECISETSVQLKQQWRWRSTKYIRKTFVYLLLPCPALEKHCYEAMKNGFSWLALQSGEQKKKHILKLKHSYTT